jgi:3-deoxy-D-manno-octulosonic-acid transferase
MSFLLNLIYLVLILFASPWLLYSAIRAGKYREGFAAKFFGRVPVRTGHRRCIWLHAVSVGEVNLLKTLLERIEREYPDCECVISTTTKTGYDLAQRKYSPRMVFYCPLDFSWATSAAMRRVRPDLLILAELELWPNLVRAARRQGAKVAVVNGRLSDKSFRGYRRIRWLVAPLLRSVDSIAAQNEEYAERFCRLGARPESVHVTGSLKFDGAQTDRDNAATRRLAKLAVIGSDDIVFLAGSTQAPEEQLALDTFQSLADEHSRLRLILVPRHPERFDEVAALLDRSRIRWQRRTQLDADHDTDGADSNTRVLLVDAVGELGAWWGTAHIAFVGGSLGRRGGQNMIEPAAYGAAVSFGPNTHNFRDIVKLMLDRQAAVVVRDGTELTQFVRCCLQEPQFADDLGHRGQQLVSQQLGATQRTLDLLGSLVEKSPADRLQDAA